MHGMVNWLGTISLACALMPIAPAGAMPPPTSDEVSRLVEGDGDYSFYSLQVEGERAVVGMPHDDLKGANSGSVHFFSRQANQWVYDGQLVLAEGAPEDYFGASVALWADSLVVGAPGRRGPGSSSGAAFIFIRSSGEWVLQQRLDSSDEAGMTDFGRWVAPSGNGILVGANQPGAAMEQDKAVAAVFLWAGESWVRDGLLQGVTTTEGPRGAVLGGQGFQPPHEKYEGRAVEVSLKGGAPIAQPDVAGCLVSAENRGLWIKRSAGELAFVPYSMLRLLSIGGPCQTEP